MQSFHVCVCAFDETDVVLRLGHVTFTSQHKREELRRGAERWDACGIKARQRVRVKVLFSYTLAYFNESGGKWLFPHVMFEGPQHGTLR